MGPATKQRDMTVFEGLSFEETLKRTLPSLTLAAPGTSNTLCTSLIETPLGPMVAIADDHSLHILEFFDRRIFGKELELVLKETGLALQVGENRITRQIQAEMRAYLAGDQGHFDTPLTFHGTEFLKSVWTALLKVPAGETRSYGALSHDIGNPKAVRAVAQANGANRLAIIVPCHRIIGADGSLTGYGGGLRRKQWLLDHERQFGNFLL